MSDITNLFGDLERQRAEQRYEEEKARLEQEKEDRTRELMDEYNESIKAEGITDEEKDRLKKDLIANYKQYEEDYTKSLEDEEEKRKNAARGAAIVDKALSASMAAINSFVAFTEALKGQAKFGAIAIIQAGAILTAGLAQQAKIIATPVSAETGGRFTAPDTGGVDGAYYRFNQGEEINVSPRGERDGRVTHYIFQIEKRVIFDVVNEGIRSGVIRPAMNL